MIFLTVGTQFGFDRLVRALDQCLEDGVIGDEVIAQIGPGRYQPKNMQSIVTLERDAFDAMLQSCDAMISHAGMGSITLALSLAKPLLVMPRRKKYGEVVNDHQVDSARRFEELGHLLVAYDTHQLPGKVPSLRTFVPTPRIPNPQGVIERVARYVEQRNWCPDTQEVCHE